MQLYRGRQRDKPVRRTAGLDTLKPKLQTVVYDILPSGGRCRKAVFGVRLKPTLHASLSGTFQQA